MRKEEAVSFIPQNFKSKESLQIVVGGEIKREALLLRPLRECSVSTCYVQKPELGRGEAPPCHALGICVGGQVTVTSWLLPSCLDSVSVSLIHYCKLVKFISGILLSTPTLWLSPLCGHQVLLLGLPPGSFHFIFPP